MREIPILLSSPMVRALLEGRKTQTRRVVKPQPNVNESFSHQYPPDGPRTSYGYSCWYPHQMEKRAKHYGSLDHFLKGFPVDFCPYGKPGDRLWVRETTHSRALPNILTGEPTSAICGAYSADEEPVLNEYEFDYSWWYSRPVCPSIHMPRWASRITLEVTGVRVQRLQEISGEDCIAEGVNISPWEESLRWNYRHLWESINGAGSWDANPWVWAVSFKVVAREVEELTK
jgi:hypothetical protein